MPWRPFLVVFVCLSGALASATEPPPRIAPEVFDSLASSDRVEVVVALRPPAVAARDRMWQRRLDIAWRRAEVIGHVLAQAGPAGLILHHQFATASGFTASVTATGLATLAQHPDVVRVELPQYGEAALAVSVPQINADIVRALGDDGRGVIVAVLDTAIDTRHPDLVGHIAGEECFCTGCCPGNTDRLSGAGSASTTSSRVVHGTHVTGILVSQGVRVASIGVAPGAQVLAVHVLNDDARGELADWIAALDWLAANRPDVRVVNMSLTSSQLFPLGCESLSAHNMLFGQVIEALRVQRTLVFAASGNNASTTMLAAPACIAAAVAVGAVDQHNTVASFSNSNASLDLLGPGVSIRSTAPNQSTAMLTGTSMATPHAAGVAALLWSAVPDLDADQVERQLRDTGVPITDARNGLVVPRVDALASYRALQRGGSLVLGGGSRLTDCLVEWAIDPVTAVQPTARPIAICHDGDPVCDHDDEAGQCTFALSLCFNVPDGRAAHCRSNDPITAVTLDTPRRDRGDAVDRGNAAALTEGLPTTPMAGTRVCTDQIPIVVSRPSGRPGERLVRLTATSRDRRDTDRARFICLPPR